MNTLIVLFYTLIRPFAPVRDRISFLSRQGSTSLDFDLLEEQIHLLSPHTQVKRACKQAKGVLALGVLTIRQLWLIASSKAVVVDGYVPALSLLEGRRTPPSVQIWHALGAIKKFGYQSLDTEAGHSTKVAQTMKMHRNYTKIVSAGPGGIPAYSQAFGYLDKASQVFEPIGIPRMDYLLDPDPDCPRMRNQAAAREQFPWLDEPDTTRILYAPTLRTGAGYHNWLPSYIKNLAEHLPAKGFQLIVSGHPLDFETQGMDPAILRSVRFVPGFSTIDLFDLVDNVVTDYSAIALEAGLAGKRVLFYVPDYQHYRTSPGLNIDPIERFGAIASQDAQTIMEAITQPTAEVEAGHRAYAQFIAEYFQGVGFGSAQRVAELVLDLAAGRAC